MVLFAALCEEMQLVLHQCLYRQTVLIYAVLHQQIIYFYVLFIIIKMD